MSPPVIGRLVDGAGRTGLRIRTDWATFTDWVQEHPTATLPPEFRPPQAPGPSSTAGGAGLSLPAAVAAALAVHARPEVSLMAWVWGPAGGVVACVSVADDLAAVLVRHTPAGLCAADPGAPLSADGVASVAGCAPVEVGLLRVEDVVGELLRWIPPAPPQDADFQAAGVCLGAAAAEDPLCAWQQSLAPGAGGWHRFDLMAQRIGDRVTDSAELALDLQFVLRATLGDTPDA